MKAEGTKPERNAAAEPLTEAGATALSKLERDEQAGYDGERAGAILARPPCQITPAGPGGLKGFALAMIYSSPKNRWLAPLSLSGRTAPPRFLQKFWQSFCNALRSDGVLGSFIKRESANNCPRLPA